jgi:hypothetical protein
MNFGGGLLAGTPGFTTSSQFAQSENYNPMSMGSPNGGISNFDE